MTKRRDDLLATASGLARLFECIGAGVLQQRRSSELNRDALSGIIRHRFLAEASLVGRDAALERVPADHRALCADIEVQNTPAGDGAGWVHEVAYRWDADRDTAVELWRGSNHRHYPRARRAIFGTFDAVGVTDEAVLVVDYKTGAAEYPPAGEVWQLRFGALAAARALGRDRARVALCRLSDSGQPFYEWAEFGPVELDTFAVQLADLLDDIELARSVFDDENVPTSTGPHCKYCPSRDWCPSMTGFARLMGQVAANEAPRESLVGIPPDATDQQVARALERADIIEQLVTEVRAQAEKLAAERDIPLRNGYVLGLKEHPSTEIDAVKAVPVLATLFGEDVASAAVSLNPEMTQAGIKRALRPYVQGHSGITQAEAHRQAMAALLESGAAQRQVELKVMRHRKRRQQAQLTEGGSDDSGDNGTGSGDEEEQERQAS
jgi:hypothetical protein